MNQADLDIHLAAIQAADAQAFASWMAAAEGALRRSLRGFAASVDVEAVLQEGLLRMWQLAPAFVPDGRPNALLRYTHRICRNLALSECRRLRTTADESALESVEAPMPDAPDPILRRHLDHCRQELPQKPAQALAQRLASHGEPDALLAQRVGMTLNTFLQNFTRARKLLVDCLRGRGVTLAGEA
jgi:DNA-directed RNA polymerase specialized sigma24 family protein